MNSRIRISFIAAIALFLGSGGVFAQTVGSDEAVDPAGITAPKVGFTATQKNAIYAAVMLQKVRASSPALSAAVGASVPRTTALSDLPDQVISDQPWAEFLKYAMVEDDVVVVDPIAMRVVDIIPGRARP